MPKKMNLVLQQLRDEEGAREDVRRERELAAAAVAHLQPAPVAPSVDDIMREAELRMAAASLGAARASAAARIQRFLRWRMRVKLWWEAYWDEEAERLEREYEREQEQERDWSRESCNVCGRPCDDDWGWTGHCSRYCATSYDRRERW
jgi:hypothetical protein